MKEDLKRRIAELKEEKNAVILAHYYAPAEVQEVADFVGDSFYLAKVAKESAADTIVFAGVYFMGESAKILNPKKRVLMPDPSADCPMAHMVREGVIERMRAEYPDLAVVCYINSSAELKAKSDVCVTSSNALKIVREIGAKNIFFIPDKNLGAFVKESVPEKNVILNDGCCPIHAKISRDELDSLVKEHPGVPVLSHPECEREILEVSEFIGSTADIIAYAKRSEAREFIICTEEGVLAKLSFDSPEKKFYFPKTRPTCTDMKLNTLEGVIRVLETGEGEIRVDERVAEAALLPLEKMLELAK